MRILRIKLIDAYLFSNFFRAFLFSLIGLVFVFVFINLLDYLRIQTTQSRTLLYLAMVYSLPQIVVLVMPAAIMFSVTFVVSSMTYDREFLAIFSSGVSFYRAIISILIFSVFLSIFLFFFHNLIVIRFNEISLKYLNEYRKNIKDIQTPKEMIFQFNFKGKDSYFFLPYFDPKTTEITGGFHVLKFRMIQSQEIPELMIEAEKATYNQETKKWTLHKVREISFNEDLTIESINFFLEKTYDFIEDIEFFRNPNKEPAELNIWELQKEIEFRKKYSLDYSIYQVHYYSLFSFPLITILSSLIGAIVGNMGNLREANPFVKSLLSSTLLVFVYQLLYRLGISLGEAGVISPFLAGWSAFFLFLIVVVVLILKHRR
ncbi:MAG: LptF/LptG family permease [Leptospiraceae bacterium]|nr:LptF/LptG family permease [Leptospiraceae bacterium]MDW7975560.1 LptF/LptG family permease [Leptospiraceae bacterium]